MIVRILLLHGKLDSEPDKELIYFGDRELV
jgi:hypothetical protein